jgi:ribonuclease J
MIEIRTVGGYKEVGRNMTAIKIDDEVVIFDMGLHLPNYIALTQEEREDVFTRSAKDMIKAGAVPDDSQIKDWKDKVKAIISTHAHLDHIGAIPYLASKYRAPFIGTPFTVSVLKSILKDEKMRIKNRIIELSPNATYRISKNLMIEFINMTHSTPQTVMAALHTKYGVFLYANDFKFDNHPMLGKKPNYKALEKLKGKVFAAVIDSLYADHSIKTPSEAVAKEMLRDVLMGTDSRGKAVLVTTFSSHIARLKTIAEFGKLMNRKVVFLGRSLAKYINAAEEINLVNLSKQGKVCKFAKDIRRELISIQKKGKQKYLIVLTGHQGEPRAVLSKMIDNILPFHFDKEDHVIFSCAVIPTPINQKSRAELEAKLRNRGARIFKDIHVSGHAAREDLRDLLNLVRPEHVIPAHAEDSKVNAMVDLCIEMGYSKDNIHPMNDKEKLILK